MKFIRYGSLVTQYHDISKIDPDAEFHAPPVENGFYAFPENYVEPFLLGGLGEGSVANGRYRYYKEDGKFVFVNSIQEYDNKITEIKSANKHLKKKCFSGQSFYEELDSDGNFKHPIKLLIENDRRKFEYDGLVWHHFIQNKTRHIHMKIIGSWALDDINTYRKLLRKYTNECKLWRMKNYNLHGGFVGGMPMGDKDDFEVYIESVQSKPRKR